MPDVTLKMTREQAEVVIKTLQTAMASDEVLISDLKTSYPESVVKNSMFYLLARLRCEVFSDLMFELNPDMKA